MGNSAIALGTATQDDGYFTGDGGLMEFLILIALFMLIFSAAANCMLCMKVDYWHKEAQQLCKDNEQLLNALLQKRWDADPKSDADWWRYQE